MNEFHFFVLSFQCLTYYQIGSDEMRLKFISKWDMISVRPPKYQNIRRDRIGMRNRRGKLTNLIGIISELRPEERLSLRVENAT